MMVSLDTKMHQSRTNRYSVVHKCLLINGESAYVLNTLAQKPILYLKRKQVGNNKNPLVFQGLGPVYPCGNHPLYSLSHLVTGWYTPTVNSPYNFQ
jgi:hypothetical protein